VLLWWLTPHDASTTGDAPESTESDESGSSG
jgi:hypothetical protein